jgi:hypothetical protein
VSAVNTRLRTLDDGAWVSVNDRRRAGASELWRVRGVCDCPVADLLVEGIVDVGVDGRTITARVAGRCLACGDETVTGHLAVGRVVDGSYRPLADDAVRVVAGESARSRVGGTEPETTAGSGE